MKLGIAKPGDHPVGGHFVVDGAFRGRRIGLAELIGLDAELTVGQRPFARQRRQRLPSIISRLRLELVAVEIEFVDQPFAVAASLLGLGPVFVPIPDLSSNEYAEHDDAEIDPDREPVLRRDMLADAADDHGFPLPFDSLLTIFGEAASVNKRETPWPPPIRPFPISAMPAR